MTLVRFDPFSMFRDIDRMFDEPLFARTGVWSPRVDVFDREGNLVIRAEVAGVDEDTLDVTVDNGTLTITGSRSFEASEEKNGYHRKEIFEGSFKRTVLLPEGTDPEAISATHKNGILEVTVPRKPEVLPRKVTVDVQR